MAKVVTDRIENIVGKGENAGYYHFLIFPQHVQKLSISELLTFPEQALVFMCLQYHMKGILYYLDHL